MPTPLKRQKYLNNFRSLIGDPQSQESKGWPISSTKTYNFQRRVLYSRELFFFKVVKKNKLVRWLCWKKWFPYKSDNSSSILGTHVKVGGKNNSTNVTSVFGVDFHVYADIHNTYIHVYIHIHMHTTIGKKFKISTN